MSTTATAKPKSNPKPKGRKTPAAKAMDKVAAKKLSFTAYAEKILRAKGEPMHVKDLTAAARKAGLKTSGATPEATMAARLGGAPDRFRKLGKGMFELK
jgi:HB1, ASXL, restriction endonuclease HTH domain